MEKYDPANVLPVRELPTSSVSDYYKIPKPPPLPVKTCKMSKHLKMLSECYFVQNETKGRWDQLFKEGHGADVYIITADGSCIQAHCNVLNLASPVLENILKNTKAKNGVRCINISGVPYGAVHMFIRFLFSSCYEMEDMKKFAPHLLLLLHSYPVPSLRRVCGYYMAQNWLTKENVVDVLQLARSCDAPRLSLFCVRMIVKDFKNISSTEGWKVMKHADPELEQEL